MFLLVYLALGMVVVLAAILTLGGSERMRLLGLLGGACWMIGSFAAIMLSLSRINSEGLGVMVLMANGVLTTIGTGLLAAAAIFPPRRSPGQPGPGAPGQWRPGAPAHPGQLYPGQPYSGQRYSGQPPYQAPPPPGQQPPGGRQGW